MKITGLISRQKGYSTGTEVLQLEATQEELLLLMGYRNEFGNVDKIRDHLGRFIGKSETEEQAKKRLLTDIFSVGDEIDVSAMFKTISDLSRHGKEVLEFSAKLKAAASLIDSLPDTLRDVHVKPNEAKSKEGGVE